MTKSGFAINSSHKEIQYSNLQSITSRKFSLRDQVDFGRFSGDKNPIHVNPIAARRTLHGVCIVHGMHAVLWALEQLTIKNSKTISSLKARFSNPLVLNCDTKLLFDEKLQKIVLTQKGIHCISIFLKLGAIKSNFRKRKTLAPHPKPADKKFEFFSVGSKFHFNLHRETSYKTILFPTLSRVYGDLLVDEMAGLSQLVGMECPGVHSLFAAVSLSLYDQNKTSSYKVVKLDERLNLIHIEVSGFSVNSILECFFRPKPVANLTYEECIQLVKKNEFKDVNALIVGGSRGLGECTAKLISAGGGKSVITYFQGAKDAALVQADINSMGGFCEILAVDIDQLDNIKINFQQSGINQLYYFASPKILSERGNVFDVKQKYAKFYCHNFKRLVNNLIRELDSLSIFYPSTVYINEKKRGFEEYIKAKLGGESICQELVLTNSDINIIFPRLPVLQTDQNQSIAGKPQNSMHNATILLPEIRRMKALLI